MTITTEKSEENWPRTSLEPESNVMGFLLSRPKLQKGANLIVSFPIGRENIIEFNAHRICNLDFVNTLFKNFELKDETFIFSNRFNSRKEFLNNKQPNGIGCFHFIKNFCKHDWSNSIVNNVMTYSIN